MTKALVIEDHGSPPILTDMERSELAANAIRVRISACGLNFADLLMAWGTYQDIPPLPVILGMELAGTVIEVGNDAPQFTVGQRVAVNSGHGGLAGEGCFPASAAMPIPDAMSFVDAAAFMVAYGTSHLGLKRRARLMEGERLVVLGAAGGVGLTAVEIGALMGAEIVAVARGEAKLEAARAAGAHHLIDSEAGDLRERVKALGGADVVYDAVGGALTKEAIRACNPEARVLIVGFASGDVPQIAANHLLVKNVDVIGYYWGAYRKFAPELLNGSLAELMEWYEAGRIRPHVSETFPLERATEAMEFLRSRRSTGKVVVTMD